MVAATATPQGASLARLFFILLLLAATPALAQAADDAEECLNLGRTEADAGSDRRIEVCTRAIESGALAQEKLAATLGARGAAYLRKGDLDRAIADYDAALRLAPDDADALLNRAMARGEKGDYPAAIMDFKAVIERNPQSVPAYNGRCYTLALMGDAVRALEDCNSALALAPNTPYILDSRAYAFLRAGDFRRAAADYDLILQIEPRNAPALYGRGIARLRLGRQQDGQQDLAAARAADTGIDAAMGKIGLTP
jgi:tetratricopeptide (TPR) repeat protein